MATRRLAMGAVILGLAWSSPGLAQYMALTNHAAPAEAPRVVVPPAGPLPLPPPRPTARVLDGELPNQHTGPKHERVVRDICIGCDR
ncbi:hypothetical protein G3T14_14390 [Methylobacterium sp. BTF04]|uniref:hypothetical protein n=1 Tax=Methylobacterium sp. BTF04 TaxID=2708300 RepID=UPI0013D18140|nr:hypothetical protein [Methylobacterium sp. BTF04]NEU13311.1 hypothetical protein [Methylobacterium sp. BTF04]